MSTNNEITEPGSVPIKRWTQGVPVEDEALRQLSLLARLPVVWPHVAVMPDVHVGIGATVGSVVPTRHAIIPAAVGVDIGCGMIAARTSLHANDLPDSLASARSMIEQAVPHGRTTRRGVRDEGAWNDPPNTAQQAWAGLERDFKRLSELHPRLKNTNHLNHLGTLGTGNHFVELCLDEADRVWVMLHSGSRGIGNAIGTHFIALAQADMRGHIANLPHRDLAYFEEGSRHFDDYVFAVDWAQRFARENRAIMMGNTLATLAKAIPKPFTLTEDAFRRRTVRDPQGRGERAPRPARHHPGIDGREELHRSRSRQRRRILLLLARRRSRDEPHAREAGDHARRAPESHRACRMPQGCRGDRRIAGGVQVDRCGHGRAARPGRDRAHLAAGGVRQRIRASRGGTRIHQSDSITPVSRVTLTLGGIEAEATHDLANHLAAVRLRTGGYRTCDLAERTRRQH
jgi:hypothetical protein